MAKPKAQFRRPGASEQLVLEHFQVRRLTAPEELARCDALIAEHHYLHNATLVGEHLRYVATYKGEWLALVTFSAASYHLRYRDQFIGWSPEQRRARLPLVVNNSRFLVLPDAHYPNLPSRLLKHVLARLSDDWLERWGHPVALVETFVDPELFRGTTYQASGWSEPGPTSGFGRHAQDFYQAHERPKQLWVKEVSATRVHRPSPRGTHRRGRANALVARRVPAPPGRGRDPRPAGARLAAPPPVRPLPRAQDPGLVRVVLAPPDQRTANPALVRTALCRRAGQRHLLRRRRPGQDALVDRPRLRRLSGRPHRALHHRRRRHQQPGGRAAAHRLQTGLKRHLAPAVLVLDEIGYLPLDKAGADPLLQIVNQRYERGSIVVTTNKAYKHWPAIFNNEAGITAAILDRLLHRAQTVVIEGKSYRMKDRHVEESA